MQALLILLEQFFDAIGALLWSGVAVAAGWVFRDAVIDVIADLEQAGLWVMLALALALALHLAVKTLRRDPLFRTLRMAGVGVDALQAMLRPGERPLLVDVRPPSSQEQGRIPGALWIDSRTFDLSPAAGGPDPGAAEEAIVYCACPDEANAALVAKQLMRAGFKRVRPLAGGIEAWVERGYGIEMPTHLIG